jgi:hypothetical protein
MKIVEFIIRIFLQRKVVQYEIDHLNYKQIYDIANKRNREIKNIKWLSRLLFYESLYYYEREIDGKIDVTKINNNLITDVSAEISIINLNGKRVMQIKFYLSFLAPVFTIFFSLMASWAAVDYLKISKFWLLLTPIALVIPHLIFKQNLVFINEDILKVFELKQTQKIK